ncbi:MAG: hypothetical protein ACK4P3_09980, partial [Fimbriimonadaceae bacterium]
SPLAPSLYAAYQLPPLAPPKPGEQTMLRVEQLDTFAAALHQPRRIPKRKRRPDPGGAQPS